MKNLNDPDQPSMTIHFCNKATLFSRHLKKLSSRRGLGDVLHELLLHPVVVAVRHCEVVLPLMHESFYLIVLHVLEKSVEHEKLILK